MGGGGTLGDTDNTPGVSFGDTAVGDLLGFDGKVGVQGASIADSFMGARRTGGTGTKSQSLEAATPTSSTPTSTAIQTLPESMAVSGGGGLPGGFTSIGDMFDGGGPGASTSGGTDFAGPNPDGSAGNDGPSGGNKIVCTAMNEAYGFGSYRQAIWLMYSKEHMTEHHEKGYHKIFLPLIDRAYKRGEENNMFLRKVLENIARHRTADIRAETQGKKRDKIGRAYRFVLEPLCYIVGKLSK